MDKTHEEDLLFSSFLPSPSSSSMAGQQGRELAAMETTVKGGGAAGTHGMGRTWGRPRARGEAAASKEEEGDGGGGQLKRGRGKRRLGFLGGGWRLPLWPAPHLGLMGQGPGPRLADFHRKSLLT